MSQFRVGQKAIVTLAQLRDIVYSEGYRPLFVGLNRLHVYVDLGALEGQYANAKGFRIEIFFGDVELQEIIL